MNEQELFRLIDLYASAYGYVQRCYDFPPVPELSEELAKAKEAIMEYIKSVNY